MMTYTVRQQEYTGENRCIRCTAVNLLIAAVLSGAIGVVSVPLMLGSFTVFVGIIYIRGYLIPGTPTLTKRYFPKVAFQFFDNQLDDNANADSVVALTNWPGEWIENGTLNPERMFCDLDVLIDCEHVDDLCLSADFRDAWITEIETLRDADVQTIFTTVTDTVVSDEQVSVDDTESAFSVEYDGKMGFYHGLWESRAAFVADMAADLVFQTRVERWSDAEMNRIRLLESLRVFLEQCPVCDGPVMIGEERIESCCHSQTVIATTCRDCSARLFELDATKLT